MFKLDREDLLYKASYQEYFSSEELKELTNDELAILAFEVEIDFNDEVFESCSPDEAQEAMRSQTILMSDLLAKYNK